MITNALDSTYKYSEIEKSAENQQEFPIFFSYDPEVYLEKPTAKAEIGAISNRLNLIYP